MSRQQQEQDFASLSGWLTFSKITGFVGVLILIGGGLIADNLNLLLTGYGFTLFGICTTILFTLFMTSRIKKLDGVVSLVLRSYLFLPSIIIVGPLMLLIGLFSSTRIKDIIRRDTPIECDNGRRSLEEVVECQKKIQPVLPPSYYGYKMASNILLVVLVGFLYHFLHLELVNMFKPRPGSYTWATIFGFTFLTTWLYFFIANLYIILTRFITDG